MLKLSTRQTIGVSLVAALVVFLFVLTHSFFDHVEASDVAIIQYPYTGQLRAAIDPGTYLTYGGTVTRWSRRTQYSFSAEHDQGTTFDESIPVRFDDGGKAKISGVLSWDMPISADYMFTLKRSNYNTVAMIDQQLVRPAVVRALSLTASLMSSTESVAARRGEFLSAFTDQLTNGIYQTETHEGQIDDPITGTKKTVKMVDILKDKAGQFLREGPSPLAAFGIRVQPPTINDIAYDADVETQITNIRAAVMAVQTKQAEARQAEQDAITAEQRGKANAATAKWVQETIKAQAVTEALQHKEVAQTLADQEKAVAETAAIRDKDVAETAANREKNVASLAKDAAEFTKAQQILLGQGESERRRLVLAADNALTARLTAYVAVQHDVWAAIGSHPGAWVPGVVVGNGGNTNGLGNVGALVDLFVAKYAQELGVTARPGAVGPVAAPPQ